MPGITRQELVSLRAEVRRVLRRIDDMLGKAPRRRKQGRPQSKLQVVLAVLSQHPEGLNIEGLVREMRKGGYVFTGDPVRSTRTLLYSRPEFESERGIFRLARRHG